MRPPALTCRTRTVRSALERGTTAETAAVAREEVGERHNYGQDKQQVDQAAGHVEREAAEPEQQEQQHE